MLGVALPGCQWQIKVYKGIPGFPTRNVSILGGHCYWEGAIPNINGTSLRKLSDQM